MLAKKGKRILSRLIDMSIVFLLTIITYISFVYPNTFDKNKFDQNNLEILELYEQSGLFVIDDEGNYNAKCSFNNIMTLEDIYSLDASFGGKTYHDISLTESLYTYYTTSFINYGGLNNLTYDTYCSNILKINTIESNIKYFDKESYTFELIDPNTPDVTIIFFIKQYQTACKNLISNSKIQTLTTENQTLMLDSIVLLIPLLIGFAFIFDFLVPVFSKESQTIGKHILGLAVISKDGYHYKKSKHVLRFFAYVVFELLLGIATIGGFLLISYTMFLFVRNRRCLHDVVGGSVVIEKNESFFFRNPVEEQYYEERSKRRSF